MPLMRGHAYRKSVQIDAVPFELPLEKIIDAVSREGERIVKASGFDIVPAPARKK